MANQTRQLADLLRAERATVFMVRSNAPYRPAFIARLPVLRAAFRLLPYLRALWQTAGRCDVFHVMANSGWAWHLFAAPAIWIARMRRVPVVVNYRGGMAPEFLARSRAIVRCSMKRVAKLAVPSRFLEEVFNRNGMVAHVLPNIVDLDRFSPGPRLPSRAPHLVVTRNLEPIYGNETAIRALALVRQRFADASLTIAGIGAEEGRLRALVAGLGLEPWVRFAGRLDRDAMAALYRSADVALNPSLADNMPNSMLEAWASGVPVVSTNVGGIPFIAEDGRTALLVPPKAPDLMAAAVVRLLEERSLGADLAAAGLREAERYAWLQVAPALASLYRSAMIGEGFRQR